MASKFENNPIVQQARGIATRAHAGQKRWGSNDVPYITHPEAVAAGVEARLDGTVPDDLLVETIAAAWLHDTVEDTDITIGSLIEAKVPPQVIAMVDTLTQQKAFEYVRGDETYYDYIIRVAEAKTMARWIKAEDLIHNGSTLGKGSMRDKYRFAYARVTGENPPF
jgi:(p)ppGpp synthase/HD superfamily hydrolase